MNLRTGACESPPSTPPLKQISNVEGSDNMEIVVGFPNSKELLLGRPIQDESNGRESGSKSPYAEIPFLCESSETTVPKTNSGYGSSLIDTTKIPGILDDDFSCQRIETFLNPISELITEPIGSQDTNTSNHQTETNSGTIGSHVENEETWKTAGNVEIQLQASNPVLRPISVIVTPTPEELNSNSNSTVTADPSKNTTMTDALLISPTIQIEPPQISSFEVTLSISSPVPIPPLLPTPNGRGAPRYSPRLNPYESNPDAWAQFHGRNTFRTRLRYPAPPFAMRHQSNPVYPGPGLMGPNRNPFTYAYPPTVSGMVPIDYHNPNYYQNTRIRGPGYGYGVRLQPNGYPYGSFAPRF